MTIIYLASSYKRRLELIEELAEKLTVITVPNSIFKIEKHNFGFNVLQLCGEHYVVIRKYMVLLTPITFNFSSVQDLEGEIYIDCEDVLEKLRCISKKLEDMQGIQTKGRAKAKYDKLAAILHGLQGETTNNS